ncbi:MAG TPA: hypothetical protein VF339_18575 [Gammaproteobacteria bacterium]
MDLIEAPAGGPPAIPPSVETWKEIVTADDATLRTAAKAGLFTDYEVNRDTIRKRTGIDAGSFFTLQGPRGGAVVATVPRKPLSITVCSVAGANRGSPGAPSVHRGQMGRTSRIAGGDLEPVAEGRSSDQRLARAPERVEMRSAESRELCIRFDPQHAARIRAPGELPKPRLVAFARLNDSPVLPCRPRRLRLR